MMGQPGNTPDEHAATLGPGTRLGKYEIVRLLGAGGMGAVYEASHVEIGKRVAIKVLSPAITAVPGARARFLREAQLTSRVRHPNIVDVTDMGSDAGQTYLVMEFLRGEDLSQRLDRTGAIPAQELADILIPVCSAVVAAHQAGVTHRDLKPQNIFLAAGPHTVQPKVLDFGISKGNDIVGPGTLTGTGAMIGTPFYLAPEQIMDARSAGPASDQYALGVILYECLTACRPFEADSLFVVFQAIVTGSPRRPRERRTDLDIPAALEEIALKAMSVDPKARFASTQHLGRALLPFASARMRSIWEEAFAIPGGDAEPAAPQEGSAPASQPMARATATASSTPAAQTPGPMPPWVSPLTPARPSGPFTPPVDRPPIERRGRFAGVTPVALTRDGVVDDRDVGGPPSRLRNAKWIGILGGVLAGVLIVVLVGLRSGSAPSPSPLPSPSPSPTLAPPRAAEEKPVIPMAAKVPSVTAPPASPAPTTPPRPVAETYKVSVSVVPASAAIDLDGAAAGRGRIERSFPADHQRHTLRFSAAGFDDRTVEFVDAPPPEHVGLVRVSRPEPTRAAAAPSVSPRPKKTTRTHGAAPHSLNPNGAPVID